MNHQVGPDRRAGRWGPATGIARRRPAVAPNRFVAPMGANHMGVNTSLRPATPSADGRFLLHFHSPL